MSRFFRTSLSFSGAIMIIFRLYLPVSNDKARNHAHFVTVTVYYVYLVEFLSHSSDLQEIQGLREN